MSEENGLQQRSLPVLLERCERYRGTVCNDHMNSRSLVFMRSGENQSEIETRLEKNLRHVEKILSPECYPDALRVACVTLFPPCRNVNHTAKPLQICKESCLQFPASFCAKGFQLLAYLKVIQAVDDCESLPETDSNEPCARVTLPGSGNNYKDEQCKRNFRLKSLRVTALKNRFQPITDSNSICDNVKWQPIGKGAKHLLKRLLPRIKKISGGKFAKFSNNVNCFRVPVKMSTLIANKNEFSRIIPLPEFKEISYDSNIYGFSVTLNQENKIKELMFPIGHMDEYGIDNMVTIPNITAYFYKDTSSAKIFGKGTFNLCGTEFQIGIEQTKSDETLLTGKSAQPVDLSTIELAFGLRPPTANLRQIMESFRILKLRLTNPTLSVVWENKQRRTMRFSGQAYNSGWGNAEVNVELLLGGDQSLRGGDQSFWATAVTTTKQSFKEIFGIFADWKHVRLAKLLDMSLDVNKFGFVLATQNVKIPKHPFMTFEHEPAKSMAQNSISSGLMLEAHANVKNDCKRNDNRSFVCQLIQFTTGMHASTKISIKSDLNGLRLVLEFLSGGKVPQHSTAVLLKLRKMWKKIDPFSRFPSKNIEITENLDDSWKFKPRYNGLIWLRSLTIRVENMDTFDSLDSKRLHLSGDVIIRNTRYTYKIKHVDLSYCLRLLDSITEVLKHCQTYP